MKVFYSLRIFLLCTLALYLPDGGALLAQAPIFRGGQAGGDDSQVVAEAALPAELLHFAGEATGQHVLVRWATENEFDIEQFVVEYATDGVNFLPVGRRDPQGGRGDYSVRLPRPRVSEAYYRLRVEELDGLTWYSDIDHLTFNGDVWSFSFRNNPVTDGKPILNYAGLPAGEGFSVRITDTQGQTVHSGVYRAEDGQTALPLAVRLHAASYFVTVVRQDGDRQSRQLVVPR